MFSYLPNPSNSSFFRPWSHRNLQGGKEKNKGTREEESQRVSRITGSSPLQLPQVSSEHSGCPSACRRVSLPNAETARLRRSLTPNAVQPTGSSFQRSRNASANAPPRSQWKMGIQVLPWKYRHSEVDNPSCEQKGTAARPTWTTFVETRVPRYL